jgi:hypothetical protein
MLLSSPVRFDPDSEFSQGDNATPVARPATTTTTYTCVCCLIIARYSRRSCELLDSIELSCPNELTLSIWLFSIAQAFFTPVFAFAGFCMALYKHWK